MRSYEVQQGASKEGYQRRPPRQAYSKYCNHASIVMFGRIFCVSFGGTGRLLALYRRRGVSVSRIVHGQRVVAKRYPTGRTSRGVTHILRVVGRTTHSPVRGPVHSVNKLVNKRTRGLTRRSTDNRKLYNRLLRGTVACTVTALRAGTSVKLVITSPATNSTNVIPKLLLTFRRMCRFSSGRVRRILFGTNTINCLTVQGTAITNTIKKYRTRINITSTVTTSTTIRLVNKAPGRYLSTTSAILVGVLKLIYSPIKKLMRCPYRGHGTTKITGTLVTTRVSLTNVSRLVPFSRVLRTVCGIKGQLPIRLHRATLDKYTAAPSTYRTYRVRT